MQDPDRDPRSHKCFLNIKVVFKVSRNQATTKMLNCNLVSSRKCLLNWIIEAVNYAKVSQIVLQESPSGIPKCKVRHNNFFDYLSKTFFFSFVIYLPKALIPFEKDFSFILFSFFRICQE